MVQEIDWNERWKMELERSTWWKSGGTEEWTEEAAKRFHDWIKQPECLKRHERIVKRLNVRPGDTVLDIGSGPGTYAVPLAQACKSVTAIDASKAMLSCLEKYASQEGLSNIVCIEKRWEDIEPSRDVEKYDLVIASHSLSMLDMKAALKKMNRLAARSVYLLTGTGPRREEYDELWFKLHGEAYRHGPDYIHIYNILFQMGVFANVEISDSEYRHSYADMDDALDRWKQNCRVTDGAGEEILRSYLSGALKEEGGELWITEKQKEAMIWWDNAGNGA